MKVGCDFGSHCSIISPIFHKADNEFYHSYQETLDCEKNWAIT